MAPVAKRSSVRDVLRLAGAALAALALAPGVAAAAAAETLTACADPPPWNFMVDRRAGGVERAEGSFSLDMLEAALARIDRHARFVAMPWARCLQQVEAGRVDFALGAYYSDERARRFAFSVPYSKTTPQVFHLRRRALRIERMADLHRYHGCGLRGGAYGHYGLAPGELDLGVNSHDKLIAKLKDGRCDYVVEELEFIAGYKRIGRDYLADPELAHNGLPDVVAPAAHLLAGRGTRGAALLPQIDQALQALIRGGDAALLWRRHSGDIPYQAP